MAHFKCSFSGRIGLVGFPDRLSEESVAHLCVNKLLKFVECRLVQGAPEFPERSD
jgi:hypothetical protein